MLQLLFLSLFSIWSAPDCFTIEERVEGSSSEIAANSVLELSTELLLYQGSQYQIQQTEKDYFLSKEELRNMLDCQYQFTEYAFADKGYVLAITATSGLDEVHKVLVYNQTSGSVSLLQDGSRWLLDRCADMTYTISGASPAIFEQQVEMVPFAEEAYTLSYQQPVFEERSELVLVKEAFEVGEVVPAEFEEVTMLILDQESNVCKDIATEYEIATEQVLISDAYTILEIVPAVFESVTEQVLVSEATIDLDIQLAKDSAVEVSVKVKDSYTNISKQWINDCMGFGVDCIDYEVQVVPQRDSIIMATVYSCPQGYTRRHDFCIQSYEEPATFTTRSFEKLVEPLQVSTTFVPATYGTESYIRIKNKNEIPDSCIEVFYRPVTYTKLAAPATIRSTPIPMEIVSRSFTRLVSPGIVTAEPQGSASIQTFVQQKVIQDGFLGELSVVNEVFVTEMLLELLQEVLLAKGYTKENIYENYFDYLCDKGWPITGITDYALEDLGINIEQVQQDTIIAQAPAAKYDLVMSKQDADPHVIHQLVAAGDCQSTYQLSASTAQQTIAFDETYFLSQQDVRVSKFRSDPEGDLVYFTKLGSFVEHVLIDYSIDNCQERFPVTHLGGDTIWLDVRQIFYDDEERKVIEFDITISQCASAEPIYFQFIEGIGTNAGITYDIENGQVTSLLLCHQADEAEVYRQADFDGGCSPIFTAVTNHELKTRLWPNPASTSIQLISNSKIVKIIDQTGRSVTVQKNGASYDISHLNAGVYQVIIQDEFERYGLEKLVVL